MRVDTRVDQLHADLELLAVRRIIVDAHIVVEDVNTGWHTSWCVVRWRESPSERAIGGQFLARQDTAGSDRSALNVQVTIVRAHYIRVVSEDDLSAVIVARLESLLSGRCDRDEGGIVARADCVQIE